MRYELDLDQYDALLEIAQRLTQGYGSQVRVTLFFALLCEAFDEQGISVDKGISELMGWRDPSRGSTN